MKHKTWFRLVLKAIGVFLVADSAPGTLQLVAYVIEWLAQSSVNWGATMFPWSTLIVYPVASVAQAAFGLYLFFGGKFIVNLAIPSNRPYCPECGYDIGRAGGSTCPECGAALPRPASADTPQPPRSTL